MPKRKKPAEKPEKQFERFVETARELEVDESGKPLRDAFKGLASPHGQSTKAAKQKKID